MARASTYTLLSLDYYARLMGIPPVGFNSGIAAHAFPLGGGCSDVWWQWDWQANDKISRESLAVAIHDAEEDISRALGWSPAPTWAWREEQPWPRFHMHDVVGANRYQVDGRDMPVRAGWRKVIAPGRRASTLVVAGTAIVYTDADADGFVETATVTFATTITDRRELHFYHPTHSGEESWEIRPPRTLTIAGGVATATFWTWQCVLESLWDAFPGNDGMTAVNMEDAANLLTTMDCYRVRNDESQAAVQFVWMPDQITNPTALTETTQYGTLLVRDAENAQVTPYPATYSTSWTRVDWNVCLPPEKTRLWYYHGEQQRCYQDETCVEPLSLFWAQAIAWLATARLERPFCACGNAVALSEDLRTDLALMGSAFSFATTEEILGCPFGTRKGAVMAWTRVAKFGGLGIGGVAI